MQKECVEEVIRKQILNINPDPQNACIKDLRIRGLTGTSHTVVRKNNVTQWIGPQLGMPMSLTDSSAYKPTLLLTYPGRQ